jgi:hypothetical protein
MLVKEQSQKVTSSKGRKLRPSHLRTVADVAAYAEYLEDKTHDNHIGKRLEKLTFIGGKKPLRADFEAAVETAAQPSQRRRTGRKRKWLARVYIASSEEQKKLLKNTDGDAIPVLNAEEREYYAQRFIEEADFGAVAYCWHIDTETGRCDCHIVVVNCEPDNPARALKSWKSSVINRRIASDRIEAEINRQRQARGQDLLTTMQEHQKQKKAAAKIEDLSVQIARIAPEPVTKNNVRALIGLAGHRVTRQNSETISVLHPGRKKARRYSLPKLLAEVLQAQKSTSGPDLPPQAAPSR